MKKPDTSSKKAHLRKSLVIIWLLSLFTAVSVYAGESTEVRVTATVIGNCKILSSKDINFGQLDPGQAVDGVSEGLIAFACTRGINYSLQADEGENFDNGTGKRRMSDGASGYLPYSLQNDKTNGLGQGFSKPIEFVLRAHVMATDYQDLPAAAYADTLRIVLEP